MRLPFDPFKDELNQQKHGYSLNDAIAFEWRSAVVREDKRFDYPEKRFQAIGKIDDRFVFLVFAMTDKPFRPISLRPADDQEIALWRRKRGVTRTTGPRPKNSRR